MRKALLITITLIAALGAAAWYISTRPGKQDLTPWQFVPPDAIGVIETDKPRILQQLNADSSNIVPFLLGNDSIAKVPEPWLFSIETVGKGKTGVVIILKKTPTSTPLDLAKNIQNATIKERTFETVQINDVQINNQPWLSIAKVRGVWLVTHYPILIEHIVRSRKQELFLPFGEATEVKKLFQLSNIKQDDGNLYLNWNAFYNAAANDQAINPLGDASSLAGNMMFDLRWSNNGNTLLLNGFAVDLAEDLSVLSIFRSQKPVAFGLRNRLPDQFKYFLHFGISNSTQWLSNRNASTFGQHKAHRQMASIESLTSFSYSEFFKAIDDEVAMVALPSGEHLIVAELKEITRAMSELNKINTYHGKQNQYSHERYANEDIHVLKQSGLSETLFWPMAFDTQELYYAVTDNMLLLCDGETGLKKFIDGMSGESTLNKSLEWNKFLESTLQEANVSFFASSEMEGLFGSLRQPQKFSMQFYALEGDYYASSVMQFGKTSEKRTTVRNVKKGLDFGQSITKSPWIVRNHNDKSMEILVTDASNQLHLVSKDQKVLWSTQLSAPIQGDVFQVDLLKNGKLQYMFVSAGKIHVIDRLGRYVAGYPKPVEMENAVFTSLIDYDRSRNYRLLLADITGTIKVVDMEGAPLEGWKSKNLPRAFSDAPTHARIRQRDYYQAVTIEGEMFLFNRRGDIVDGFPVSLGIRPSGDVVSDGKQFVMVSENGSIVQVSTSGKKISENALIKKTPNATFRLVAASNADNFIIVKSEQGFLTAFDRTGKQLFEINNPASDNLVLSLTNDVLVVFDKDQNIFYACDLTGKLLIPQPLQATALPAVIYQKNTLTFYVPDQTRLVAVSAGTPQ